MRVYPKRKDRERVGMDGNRRGISAREARTGQRIMRVIEALARIETG
jgi:hypothetical protein